MSEIQVPIPIVDAQPAHETILPVRDRVEGVLATLKGSKRLQSDIAFKVLESVADSLISISLPLKPLEWFTTRVANQVVRSYINEKRREAVIKTGEPGTFVPVEKPDWIKATKVIVDAWKSGKQQTYEAEPITVDDYDIQEYNRYLLELHSLTKVVD